MKKLCVYFSAGAVGGLANGLAVWFIGSVEIAMELGVSIAPKLTSAFLYHRIVWGGIWGLIFILPIMRSKLLQKGLILSIFPTLVQLFYVFPFMAEKGYMGLDLGLLTPLFVFVYNGIWGFVAGLVIKLAK